MTSETTWTCPCGNVNNGENCARCNLGRPVPAMTDDERKADDLERAYSAVWQTAACVGDGFREETLAFLAKARELLARPLPTVEALEQVIREGQDEDARTIAKHVLHFIAAPASPPQPEASKPEAPTASGDVRLNLCRAIGAALDRTSPGMVADFDFVGDIARIAYDHIGAETAALRSEANKWKGLYDTWRAEWETERAKANQACAALATANEQLATVTAERDALYKTQAEEDKERAGFLIELREAGLPSVPWRQTIDAIKAALKAQTAASAGLPAVGEPVEVLTGIHPDRYELDKVVGSRVVVVTQGHGNVGVGMWRRLPPAAPKGEAR
jgi:hypothetical protein